MSKYSLPQSHRIAIGCLLLGVVSVLSSGCSLMELTGFTPIEKAEATSTGTPVGTCQVLINNGWDATKKVEVPIYRGMHVQDVLVSAKAIKSHKKIMVTLVRQSPQTGMPMKLPCDYDGKEDRIPYGRDYEVFPGDQVLVEYDTSLPGEDLLRPFTSR